VILEYDLPSSELPVFPGMNPAYFGIEYDLRGTDFYTKLVMKLWFFYSQ